LFYYHLTHQPKDEGSIQASAAGENGGKIMAGKIWREKYGGNKY
jgi:hypothetical protein